jgi:hypothetical protein
MDSRHCGSPNDELRALRRLANWHDAASKAIRALASSPPPKGGDEDNSVAAGAAPRTPAAEAIVEVMARAICLSHGEHPDSDAPVSHICGPNNEVQPWWEFYREQAEAALTALQASGMAVVPLVEAPSGDDEFMAWLLTPAWRPMSTAPKDGTQFLMLGDPDRYGRPVWIDRWWGDECWERAGHHNPPATLIGWMPLPAASPDGKSERPPASAEPSSASEKQPPEGAE